MAIRERPEGDDRGADASASFPSPRDVAYRSTDGLRLHVREHGDRVSPHLPVVCLPGLTRTARDFDGLARFLAVHPHRPRRVLAFDYRGRGGSEWDRNPENYNVLTEMNDVFDGMTALGVPRAIVVGTSRGGIIGMLMGVARPGVVVGLVLNDIGPVMEARGLVRIKTYVGRTPAPDDWADAARIQERLHGAQFTAFGAGDWAAFSRLTYGEVNGKPVAAYDPALALTLDGIEFEHPLPTLWNEFRSLVAVPILAIRGENSDLLSGETVAAMGAAHPRFASITVPGVGHPPPLGAPELLERIAAFLAEVEGAGPPAEAVVPRPHAVLDLDAPSP